MAALRIRTQAGRRLAFALVFAAASAGGAAQGLQIPQPSAGLMPNAAKGKQLYAKHCAACHGTELNGSNKGPPFLHKVYERSHHGDASFQLAAKNGVRAHHWPFGDMPPVPVVTPDDIAHVTAFIRLEQSKAGIR